VRLARDGSTNDDGRLASTPPLVRSTRRGDGPGTAFLVLIAAALVALPRLLSVRVTPAARALSAVLAAARRRAPGPATSVVACVATLCAIVACSHGDQTSQRTALSPDTKPRLEIRELDEHDTFIVTDLLDSVLLETTTIGEPKATFAPYPSGPTRYDPTQHTSHYP